MFDHIFQLFLLLKQNLIISAWERFILHVREAANMLQETMYVMRFPQGKLFIFHIKDLEKKIKTLLLSKNVVNVKKKI